LASGCALLRRTPSHLEPFENRNDAAFGTGVLSPLATLSSSSRRTVVAAPCASGAEPRPLGPGGAPPDVTQFGADFQASPGYDFMRDQGMEAITNSASSSVWLSFISTV